jgi:glycosyltransferase involved in cell wall biosynthesis
VFHLDVVGEDTTGGALKSECERLGLSPHVTFHGFQPHHEMPAFYGRAHLHVLSSRHEAACVAVLEAAACGVPTVGSRTGYVADFADEAACAVPPGDPAALADAIGALVDDPARRAALGRAVRRRAAAIDADRTAMAMEAVYLTAIRRHRREYAMSAAARDRSGAGPSSLDSCSGCSEHSRRAAPRRRP